ncbi:MAG: radical SAM protein [Caulobacter sp.]|nr:radical SAM protein [Caulobacter sp.]
MNAPPTLSPFVDAQKPRLDPGKFRDPDRTARGEPRAAVALDSLQTLWLNTGTLCNLACLNCYIESTPSNNALVWLTAAEARLYLDEIADLRLATREIGITGGEPFMNPDILPILEEALGRGFEVLVLTNAMTPMTHKRPGLLALKAQFGDRLTLRVSLDHWTAAVHEAERGAASWDRAIEGLQWLSEQGFSIAIAGRQLADETPDDSRDGYGRLMASLGVSLDCQDPGRLVLFPEMDASVDVPEITTACWDILHKRPQDVMCATSRMVVKRRGAEHPAVIACTLTPYDPQFELGRSLGEALGTVKLNHPHCAKFCVLGGASCSG